MLTNIKIGIMGTVEFLGKFTGQRKAQMFVTYPLHEPGTTIRVQSDVKVLRINLETGFVTRRGYEGPVDRVPTALLTELRQKVADSAGKEVGSTVKTDNSGAYAVAELIAREAQGSAVDCRKEEESEKFHAQ